MKLFYQIVAFIILICLCFKLSNYCHQNDWFTWNTFLLKGWITEQDKFAVKMKDALKNISSQLQWWDFNFYEGLETSSVNTKENIEFAEFTFRERDNENKNFSMVSDIEQLPFPDGSFDAFTANFALQFTQNYLNALWEAYRVLSKGGKAAFSIWGREENCTFLTFLPDILESHGLTIAPEFDIDLDFLDSDQILEDAKDLGFKSVKKIYLPFHYSILNGEEMWEFLLSNSMTSQQLQGMDEESLKIVKADVIKEFDQRFGEQSDNTICLEVTVILCCK